MRLSALVLALLIACGAPPGRAADIVPGSEVLVAVREGSGARLRAGPGTDTPVAGRAARGTRLLVREAVRRGGYPWYRVESADGALAGWIRGDLVEPAPPAVAATPLQPPPAGPPPAAPSPPQPPLPAWAERIPRALRGIDACLAATTKRPAAVVTVRRLPFDMVSVVIEDGSGLLWECVVEPRGPAPLRYDPLPETALGESTREGPRFFRGDTPPPGGCRRLRSFSDPKSGTVLGTFAYPGCPGNVASQSEASRTSASNSSESGRSSSSSTRK